MGKRRRTMSEDLRMEIAKELGIDQVVEREGWGGIRARDAGNMVKKAIEIANQQVANQNQLSR